jgi:hypothetical protein
MPRQFTILMVFGMLTVLLAQFGLAQEQVEHRNYKIDIDVNKEDAEVGKRRIELLDKMLSPELIERRREITRQFEEDYNRKITQFLSGVTSPNSKNTVITHVNMRFFDPGFKEQLQAEKDVSVSAILGRTGFDLWRDEQPKEQALDKLRQLISASFKIPVEHITLTLGP